MHTVRVGVSGFCPVSPKARGACCGISGRKQAYEPPVYGPVRVSLMPSPPPSSQPSEPHADPAPNRILFPAIFHLPLTPLSPEPARLPARPRLLRWAWPRNGRDATGAPIGPGSPGGGAMPFRPIGMGKGGGASPFNGGGGRGGGRVGCGWW